MVFKRVNSCELQSQLSTYSWFHDWYHNIEYQEEMERVYLIPQPLEPEKVVECQDICMSCLYCQLLTKDDTVDAVRG